MPEQTTRALVATCKNCSRTLVLLTDPTGDTEVKFEDGGPVYVECPVDVLADRDVKGLYREALAGKIAHFTGVSDPYEPPLAPDVTVRSDRERVEESVGKIWALLEARGLVRRAG